MFETRIQVEEGARLTLDEMAGDVAVSGWDEAEVLIRLRDGQAEGLVIDQTEAGPVVSARVSCELRVPTALPMSIRQVSANLTIKGLEAPLNAEQVRGNMVLKDVSEAILAEVYGNLRADTLSSLRLVGTVYGQADLKGVGTIDMQNIRGNLRAKEAGQLRVSRVGGNLEAKGVEGNLDADQVGGNAMLKEVGGSTTLDRVAGNLIAKNLTSGVKATRIGGNLVFNGELGAGRTYHFKADGNAMLRLAEGASAHLTLTAKGKLMSSVPLTEQEQEGRTLRGILGDGGTEVVVEAKGNVMVGGTGPTFGADLGDEISRQVEESLRAIDLEAIGRQVSEEMGQALSRLRVKMESVDWEHLGLQAQQAVERAMDRMQHDVDRLAEKAARHQEQLERKAQQEARRLERMERRLQRTAERFDAKSGEEVKGPLGETDYAPPEPDPDLEDERLSILRMVEQGQITPAEAEMLLDALA